MTPRTWCNSQDIEILVDHGLPTLLPNTSVPSMVGKQSLICGKLKTPSRLSHLPLQYLNYTSDLFGRGNSGTRSAGPLSKTSKPSVVDRIMSTWYVHILTLDPVNISPHLVRGTMQVWLRILEDRMSSLEGPGEPNVISWTLTRERWGQERESQRRCVRRSRGGSGAATG